MTATDAETVALTQYHVLKAVPGLSYRQLDYWTRRGLLRCVVDQHPGSGIPRFWDPEDIATLRRVVALTATGMKLSIAFTLARGDQIEWLDRDRILVSFWGDLA